MQQIATRIFVGSSLAFGIFGILMVLTSGRYSDASDLSRLLYNCIAITAFIILPSFALSVAGKYLMKDAGDNR